MPTAIRTLAALLTLAATVAAAESQPATLPAADNVEITLKPDKTEFEMGEPVDVEITFHNKGKTKYTVEEDHLGSFKLHAVFVVRDSDGRQLPNPYADPFEFECIDGPFTGHILKPGGTATFTRTLNESVRFTKPGTYTLESSLTVQGPTESGHETPQFLTKSIPTTILVKDFDRARRKAAIDALLAAYRADKFDYDKLPFDKKYIEFTGEKIDLVRILAFFDEPRLIPLFLDVIESNDVNAYADYGLLGLSDRPAVIKALEDRLDHPESHNVTELFYLYSRLRAPNPDMEHYPQVYKQRLAVIKPYRDKAVALLIADKERRYAQLASRLCDRTAGDNFIIDYLLHAKPTLAQIRWCATQLGETTLPKEDESLIAAWLACEEISVRDAAMRQLLRLNPDKYLPILREDKSKPTHRFSGEVLKLLDAAP